MDLSGTSRAIGIALSLIAAAIVGALIGLAGYEPSSVDTAQDPATETPTTEASPTVTPTLDPTRFSDPVLDAQDAISRSLEHFPDGYPVSASVARLVSIGTMDSWREYTSPFTSPEAPAWVVGILADNLTVADIFPEYYSGGRNPLVGTESVEGAYFGWDANSGALLGIGVLGSQWNQSYASLNALSDEPIPIVAATEVDPSLWPTETPHPFGYYP